MSSKSINRIPKVIIFIHSLTCGGAERVSVALSKYLVKSGYEVVILTMHNKDQDFYILDPNVKRISLDLARHTKRSEKIFANLVRVSSLRATLKAEQPDLIIGMMTASAVQAIVASFRLPVRVIASERNYPGRMSIKKQWSVLRKLLYRFADAHVVQTHKIADWLKSHAGARNVEVIPNSVTWPIPFFSPMLDPKVVVDSTAQLLLAVGSKAYQKGFDLLIPAFAKAIRCQNHNWHLVILGLESDEDLATDQRSKLMDLATQEKIEEYVHFPGRFGNVGEWYQRADIFVLSSRYEGFPNVLLEALASGCSCVAFDCDTGPRDIIKHEHNGMLVPAEDIEALGDTLGKVMADQALRDRLSSNTISVRDCFCENKIFKKWKEVIDNNICQ